MDNADKLSCQVGTKHRLAESNMGPLYHESKFIFNWNIRSSNQVAFYCCNVYCRWTSMRWCVRFCPSTRCRTTDHVIGGSTCLPPAIPPHLWELGASGRLWLLLFQYYAWLFTLIELTISSDISRFIMLYALVKSNQLLEITSSYYCSTIRYAAAWKIATVMFSVF